MTDPVRRRRDPEARRQAIIAAAAELITEVGVDAITHRMVAARADVPLGATTQYFDTLDDLRAAALQFLVAHLEQQMAVVRETLAAQGTSARTLAAITHAGLVDAKAVRADRAVVTAAVHDPRLRAMARDLSRQLVDLLAPTYGADRASAAAVFVDGLLWHAQINDQPLPLAVIVSAFSGILGEPPPSAPHHTSAPGEH